MARAAGGSRGKSRAAADPSRIVEEAARGVAPPVLLVTGADIFSRDAVLAALRAALVPEGFEAFNDGSLWGEQVSAREILTQANMLPFGGPQARRLILVRRADRIKEKDAAAIAGYAAEPSATTCLVFVCDRGKAPIAAALGSGACRLDFPAPRDYQLSRWLEAQARRLKIALDPDAAKALADLMGGNFVGAMSELQRAALHAPQTAAAPGRACRVTRRVIEELAARGRDTNPFHLGDALLSREPVRAVRILRDLMDSSTTGYAILGMIESQLRRTLKSRAEVDRGVPARTVVQSSSPTLPPDVKARLVRQLEFFDQPRLIEAFRLARLTDRAIKGSGSGSEQAHMESLVWRICSL